MAAVLYGGAYFGMEHLRTRNGPWQVTFASGGGTNAPALIINEPKLNVINCRIDFPARTAPPTNVTVVFNQAREVPFDVPFGRCIALDATSEPGTVTLTLFGHEIELLSRALTVDKKDYDWGSVTNLKIIP